MRVLLDTHVLIWWITDSPQIRQSHRAVTEAGENLVYVSSISLAEIAIKSSTGKLEVPNNLAERIVEAGFTHLPFDATHAAALGELPFHHRDPFDRMLIAQAMTEGLVFATADDRCRAYDIQTI